MSLVSNISAFATRVATEIKAVRTLVNGNASDLSALTTTAKSNLVAAINEVKSGAGSGLAINDTTPSTTAVYSSSKTNSQISAATAALVASSPAALDTLKELADAINDDANFSTTMATALGNRVRVDAAQSFTSTQQTQGQTNMGVYSQTQIGDPTTDFVAAFVAGLS